MGGNTLTFAFDPEGAWFYFTAALDTQGPQLFGAPMTDDGPGAPVRLSDGSGALPGEFITPDDWSVALYTDDTARGPQMLFEVALGTDRPSAPVQINGDLARGENVSFGARYSRSGSSILFRQQAGSFDDPRPLFLRDRINGALIEVSADGQVSGTLRELD